MQIHATLDAELQPVELPIGRDGSLYWQRVDDAAEAALYEAEIGHYARLDHALPAAALAGAWDADDLVRHRIQAVTIGDPTAGQVLAGYTLSVVDGLITAAPAFAAAPPPAVPSSIERYKAKIALHAAGKLDAAEAAVAALGLPTTIYWNEAPVFHRDHPILLGLASELGLTTSEVDALFIAAAAVG